MSEMANWDRLSRDQKIRALAFGPDVEITCPGCGRTTYAVRGYITQHTDPATWGRGRQKPEQCARELTALRPTDHAASSTLPPNTQTDGKEG